MTHDGKLATDIDISVTCASLIRHRLFRKNWVWAWFVLIRKGGIKWWCLISRNNTKTRTFINKYFFTHFFNVIIKSTHFKYTSFKNQFMPENWNQRCSFTLRKIKLYPQMCALYYFLNVCLNSIFFLKSSHFSQYFSTNSPVK